MESLFHLVKTTEFIREEEKNPNINKKHGTDDGY